MLLIVLLDTPAMCYNDQVLGEWELNITTYDLTPDADGAPCPLSLENLTTTTKHITLLSPNRALDADGYTGTWTMNYAQAVEVRIGGYTYHWQVGYTWIDSERILSMCDRSRRGEARSFPDGMTRGHYACFEAENVHPAISDVRNKHMAGFAPVIHYYDADDDVAPRKLGATTAANDRTASEDLPHEFDWRDVNGTNYVPDAVREDMCSAGAAIAVVQMLESRIRIATHGAQHPALSIQHIVDCNAFSQQCANGHPDDQARFAQQFGILTEKSYGRTFPVPPQDVGCRAGPYLSGERYFVDSYQYMGGYYGARVSVSDMMREIYTNGPIVVSIQEHGVIGSDPYGQTREYYEYTWDAPERHFYFDTVKNEALVIGWRDLPSGQMAWIVQLPYGSDWNGDGTALVAAGFNAYAIESAPFVAYWRPRGAISYSATSYTAQNVLVGILVLAVAIVMVLFALLMRPVRRSYQRVNAGSE